MASRRIQPGDMLHIHAIVGQPLNRPDTIRPDRADVLYLAAGAGGGH